VLAFALAACGAEVAPTSTGEVVVNGLLRLALATSSEQAGETSGSDGLVATSGAWSVVALGTNSETVSVPVEADGTFELPVRANASYTLNVLDAERDLFIGSFLFRTGPNVSSALRVGLTDVSLGACQLVQGEVWCENGFFDPADSAGTIAVLDDLVGDVEVTLAPHDSNRELVTALLGGTTVLFEIAPNPLNGFHVAVFNRTRRACEDPLVGVAEKIGDERYLYTQRTYTTETCQATVRYQAGCTMTEPGVCTGFLRVDVASSGTDCAEYPAVHVAEAFTARVKKLGVYTCTLPDTCTDHTECASGVCDVDVGFCAQATVTEAMRLHVFDVGNGQSILLVSPTGKSVLLDTGRPVSGRLVATIARRLVNRLDVMILSHFDDDHAGGAVPVMYGPDGAPGRKGVDDDAKNGADDLGEVGSPGSDDLLPDLVLDRGLDPLPSGFDDYRRILGSRRHLPTPGETLDLGGGATLTVVSGNGRLLGGAQFDANEENKRSVGVLVQYGDFSFLDLGDLPGGSGGEALEQALAPALAPAVPIDVHLLSHHGSAASSSLAFLKAIRPRVVAVSVGDSDRCGPGYNSYGLPTQSVLDALAAVGSIEGLYQTETGGASFTGQCLVDGGQAYPRRYGTLAPVMAYSAFTIEAYQDAFRVQGLAFDDHFPATGCSGDGCPTCPPGYVEAPDDEGCMDDPCAPDPCHGHGVCSILGPLTFACACAGHWTGTLCDACAEGHAGPDCADCAPGWAPDPGRAGACVDDPCAPDPCSGHGTCSFSGAQSFACACVGHWTGPVCATCASGYAGEGCTDCDVGYVADPTDGATCVADPCRIDPCHGNGACAVLAGGAFACACTGNWSGATCDACVEGYAGAQCADCGPGFVAHPSREGTCIDDPCAPDPCSGHGACAVLGPGAVACVCVGHWTGAACDACAPGYAGPDCATCASGWVVHPTAPGTCIDDPCAPDPCSGHGACAVLGPDSPACTCAGNWTGAACGACAPGYAGPDCSDCADGHVVDPTAAGRCIDDPCAPDPCHGHGACAVQGEGAFACACLGNWGLPDCATCAPGYAGPDCATCAEGYHAHDTACVPSVIATTCQIASPLALWTEPGEVTVVTGSLVAAGQTEAPGALPDVLARLCWAADPLVAAPELASLTCSAAAYDHDEGGADVYRADLSFPLPGDYAYLYAFSGDDGATWTLCDANGPVGASVNPGTASCHNVPNGGFERWDAALTLPTGWAADAGVGVRLEGSTAHSGARSVALTRKSTNNADTDVVGAEHPVAGGGLYTLSAWFQDTSAAARGSLTYTWYDAAHLALGAMTFSSLYTVDAPSWQELAKAVTAPAAAATVRVSVRVYGQTGGAATGGSVLLDDVAVTPVCNATACPACGEGFLPNPQQPGTCQDDPCAPDPCNGRGACSIPESGGFACACEGNWGGATCSACQAGYAGPTCADCAGGYLPDPLVPGACIDDPCAPDPCNGHGTCTAVLPNAFACACAGNWTGPACLACKTGYAGVDCAACADGYHLLSNACVADLVLGSCRVAGPTAFWTEPGEATVVHGRASVTGVTSLPGATADLTARLCWGTWPLASPVTLGTLTCVDAAYVDDQADGDDYAASVAFGAYGTYAYVFAFSGNGGKTWTACDTAGPITGTPTPGKASCQNVPNGGLERWNAAATLPDGWAADTGVGVARRETTVHSGRYAVALTRNTTNNADADFIAAERTVTAGSVYTLSVWFLDADVSARGSLTYTWYDAAHVALGAMNYGGAYTADSAAWQNQTRQVTAPANAAWVRISVRVYSQTGGAAVGGTVLLDDAAVYP
jgi:beta-lactamase superfamily II metal-dependent hydrolase